LAFRHQIERALLTTVTVDHIRFLTAYASKVGSGNRAMTGQKTNDTGFDYDRLTSNMMVFFT